MLEGELLRRKAIADLEAERGAERKRRDMAIKAQKETQKANEYLKQIKAEDMLRQQQEEEKIKAPHGADFNMRFELSGLRGPEREDATASEAEGRGGLPIEAGLLHLFSSCSRAWWFEGGPKCDDRRAGVYFLRPQGRACEAKRLAEMMNNEEARVEGEVQKKQESCV